MVKAKNSLIGSLGNLPVTCHLGDPPIIFLGDRKMPITYRMMVKAKRGFLQAPSLLQV